MTKHAFVDITIEGLSDLLGLHNVLVGIAPSPGDNHVRLLLSGDTLPDTCSGFGEEPRRVKLCYAATHTYHAHYGSSCCRPKVYDDDECPSCLEYHVSNTKSEGELFSLEQHLRWTLKDFARNEALINSVNTIG